MKPVTMPSPSNHNLTQIMDANPVPCFVIDSEHRVTHWNHSCESILGLPASAMIGTDEQWRAFYSSPRPTMADLIVDGRIEEVADGLYGEKGLSRSKIIEGAFEACDFFPHLGKGGRWLFFTAAPVRDADGRIIGAVETLQDVTRQCQAEAALQQANAELERKVAERTAELATANRELQISLAKAEEVSRLKSDFLATVSHELKTPLNAIHGFSDLIRMDPSASEVGEYAREINDSGKTLLRLLDNMLELLEIGTGNAQPIIFPDTTVELMSALVREFQDIAQARGASIELNLDASTPEIIYSDSRRLKTSLSALLDNAIRYLDKAEGRIRIDVVGSAGQLEIRVSDNGPGIPVGADETIFEQFRQIDMHSHRLHGGLGLGLALARAHVRLIGGDLRLLRLPGVAGACFILTVPCAEPGTQASP